jgi:hypothetical protein
MHLAVCTNIILLFWTKQHIDYKMHMMMMFVSRN